MENIKAFFGFANSNDIAKHRCREYLVACVAYGETLTPVPAYINDFAEFLAETAPIEPASEDSANTSENQGSGSGEGAIVDANGSTTTGTLPQADDPFWTKWDDFKEDALNLLTTAPQNEGKHPEGEFVGMWRHLEQGRLPASTAPAEKQRRRSSLARVRLA